MDEPFCILIVDDQTRARKSLRALLSTAHPAEAICEAENGRQALHMVEERQPDVILMDVCMPVLDGLHATASIKAQWPEVKVVVLSMYAEHRDAALIAGADAFAGKGEDPGKLLDIVSTVMQR